MEASGCEPEPRVSAIGNTIRALGLGFRVKGLGLIKFWFRAYGLGLIKFWVRGSGQFPRSLILKLIVKVSRPLYCRTLIEPA